MNKQMLESLFRQTGKSLLALGLSILGTAFVIKIFELTTGDELARIHHFQKGEQKGIVVRNDSLWVVPKVTLHEE